MISRRHFLTTSTLAAAATVHAIARESPSPPPFRTLYSNNTNGRTYTVTASPDLTPNSWLPLAGATVTNNGDERTVTDHSAGGTRKFYNVEIQKLPD